jgi:hypothetical protein
MLTPWILLAAPVAAAVLFWGDWAWVAVAVAVAVAQFLSYRRTERFSARVWRTVGHGQRSREARAADALYLVTVVAGLVLLVLALLRRL